MASSNLSVLMATLPGRIQQGMLALLAGALQVQAIDLTHDGTATITRLAAWHPDLLVLDTDLPDLNIPSILSYIKVQRIETRCLVLTDTLEQFAAAQTLGADSALLKGFTAEDLLVAIQRLLGERLVTDSAE